MSLRKWMVLIPVGAMLCFSVAQAQEAAPPAGGGQRNADNRQDDQGRRGRGNFDPAAMRQRWMERIKEDLGATDDEWKVLQPKIEKVMTAQRDTRGGFFGGFSSRGRGGPDRDRGPSDQPQSKVSQTQQDLRTVLENKSASSDEITKKLAAYREARDKARADLAAAQKDLKEVVTPRQEASLVMSGMLE